MRLLFAVDLDDAGRADCAGIGRTLTHRFRLAKIAPDLSWVAPEKLHITVRFIGQMDERRADAIRAAMANPLPIAPFTAALDAAGVFPVSGPPRVIWIGIGEGGSQLARMNEALQGRLAPLDLEPDRRTFSSHLTLARLRRPTRGPESAVVRRIVAEQIGRSRWTIDHVTLYESRLSPKGATYNPILSVLLGGREPVPSPEG